MISEKTSAKRSNLSRRIQREIQTIEKMIRLACRHHHKRRSPCPDCEQLRAYAVKRIIHCRFKNEKPACSECPVHCFKPDYREQIRKIMRFAGPRMIYHHPLLALFHILDKYRFHPAREPENRNNPTPENEEKA